VCHLAARLVLDLSLVLSWRGRLSCVVVSVPPFGNAPHPVPHNRGHIRHADTFHTWESDAWLGVTTTRAWTQERPQNRWPILSGWLDNDDTPRSQPLGFCLAWCPLGRVHGTHA